MLLGLSDGTRTVLPVLDESRDWLFSERGASMADSRKDPRSFPYPVGPTQMFKCPEGELHVGVGAVLFTLLGKGIHPVPEIREGSLTIDLELYLPKKRL